MSDFTIFKNRKCKIVFDLTIYKFQLFLNTNNFEINYDI